jgi:PAS domain S-box-containing protein
MLLALLGGLLVWVMDALADYYFFYPGRGLAELLILAPPGHELYIRLLILALFAGFGLLAAWELRRLRRTREKAEHSARLLRMLSECNQALVRADNEDQLLRTICRVVVEYGGYAYSWVGYAETGPERLVRPVAECGEAQGYARGLRVTWAEDEHGRGPTGLAIRQGGLQVARDLAGLEHYRPWREQAAAHGLRSSVALPLRLQDRVVGALNIYSHRPDDFPEADLVLLRELADDLAYGIAAIRTRLRHDQALAELGESEERFRATFEQAAVGLAHVDLDGGFLRVNRSLCRMLGYSREELGRLFFQDVTHPDDLPRDLRQAEQALAGDSVSYHQQKRLLAKDGSVRWANLTVSLRTDGEGRPLHFIAVVEDISHRTALEKTRARLAAIVQQSADAIYSTDLKGKVQDWNPAAERIFGYSRQEAAGRSVAMLYPPDRGPELQRILELVAAGESVGPREVVRLRRDGRPVEMLVAVSPLCDEGGRVVGASTIAREMTEISEARRRQERLEAQLRQAQKMESLGALAGGIAHDFNNILGAILGYTELTLASMQPGHPQAENLQRVMSAGQRAKALVSQILQFSRADSRERRPLSLRGVVSEAMRLLEAALPATIDLRLSLEPEAPQVEADPVQMHQLVMNLCANAAQAMEAEGGRLELALETVELDETSAEGFWELGAGRYCRLTVADTGPGMDQGTKERIFEPFFTTKERERGTGMGLAVVHGIVQSHRGAIQVYSEPGRGARFLVYLPAAQGAQEEEPQDLDQVLPRGSESILWVDDEPLLAGVGKTLLERLGYRVEACTSGREALERFRQRPAGFDLLVTDQTMPGLTGQELALRLRELRPELPVLLCTGYSSPALEDRALAAGVTRILQKPLLSGELAQAVREALDRPAAPARASSGESSG